MDNLKNYVLCFVKKFQVSTCDKYEKLLKRNSKKTALITWKMQSRNMANVGECSFDFDATESLKGPLVVRDQKG